VDTRPNTPDGTSVIVATDDTLERRAITRDNTELAQRTTLATLTAS
jgi:hypothetical protein